MLRAVSYKWTHKLSRYQEGKFPPLCGNSIYLNEFGVKCDTVGIILLGCWAVEALFCRPLRINAYETDCVILLGKFLGNFILGLKYGNSRWRCSLHSCPLSSAACLLSPRIYKQCQANTLNRMKTCSVGSLSWHAAEWILRNTGIWEEETLLSLCCNFPIVLYMEWISVLIFTVCYCCRVSFNK